MGSPHDTTAWYPIVVHLPISFFSNGSHFLLQKAWFPATFPGLCSKCPSGAGNSVHLYLCLVPLVPLVPLNLVLSGNCI